MKVKKIFLIEYPISFDAVEGDTMLNDFKKILFGYHVILLARDVEEVKFKFN